MSAPKWTPGPWSVSPNYGPASIDVWVPRSGEVSPFIARIWLGGGEDEANARLIAAAPDMYEALHNILNCKHPDARLQPDHLADAYKACAKARGEQS